MKRKLVPHVDDCYYCTFYSEEKKKYYSSSGHEFFKSLGGTEYGIIDIQENQLYWYNNYNNELHGLMWRVGEDLFWIPYNHGLDESIIYEMRKNGVPLKDVMDFFLL